MDKELRFFQSEIRATKTDEDKVVVRGYAAKFNTLSENLGGFRETIAEGAFDSVLGDDVRALINHDNNKILGRTSVGTARIGVDAIGLWYEYDSPDTSYARDLVVSLERGDIDKSSFQFTIEDEDWKEDEEQRYIRTIKKVRRLYDVSPVTFPAYPDTNVAKRSLEHFKEEVHPTTTDWAVENEARKRKVKILTLNRQ